MLAQVLGCGGHAMLLQRQMWGQPLRPAASVLPIHRRALAMIVPLADGRDGDPARRQFFNKSRSRKGKAYENKKRRRGRPAHLRSPDDTPLRDGNRDRLMGLLTERATKTLVYYLMETNLNLHYWLSAFLSAHPIPREGAWDDVSGETFLRTLLAMPVQEAKYSVGRDQMYDHVKGMGVDPRGICQRIMDIRRQMAKEFIVDLKEVPEENMVLLKESLSSSLEKLLSMPLSAKPDTEDTM